MDPELAELRGQARAMVASRSSPAKQLTKASPSKPAASSDSQRAIATQRAQLEQLKRENGQLQKAQGGRAGVPASQQERLNKLDELVDTYSRKIEVESRQVESINRELELTQARLATLRQGSGAGAAKGDHAGAHAAEKHMKVVENRLEQVEQRFGETLAENKRLREDIESLNKTREMFEAAQLKMEKELASWREKVAQLSTSVAVAGEAQHAATMQLESLRTQADKEHALFEDEARALARCFESDSRLLDAQATRLERLLDAPDVEPDAVQEEEGGLSFDEAVAQLADAAGIDSASLTALVAHYSGLEAANFSAFSDCNSENEGICAMQKQVRSLENDARQAEVEGVLCKQRGVVGQSLTKRDAAHGRAEAFDETRVAMERRMAALRGAVCQVLVGLGGAVPPEAQAPAVATPNTAGGRQQQRQAGTSTGAAATGAAVGAALGALEARARAVLAVWSSLVGRTAAVPSAGAMLAGVAQAHAVGEQRPAATAAPAQQQDRTLHRNKLYNESDDDDSNGSGDEMPLTRDQIQAQLAARLASAKT
ncbi:hypothetical protein FOA52_003828 [Chlamydomonas sp. UWO 241]|nr:hypothetical protein FOA52_003828 [Chlamydomonas sp. UWO 241]